MAHRTLTAEVAVRHVSSVMVEPLYEQLVVTEIAAVVSGTVLLAGRVLGAGDVLVVPTKMPG